jgi:type IV pilus assembly protein PilA
MLEKLREKRNEEAGFTLVELLVVMLILGILAAIAIPSFFAQRDKATDAEAKSAVKTAQTAIETYATENDGSYLNATPAILKGIEETLPDAPTLAVSGLAEKGYTVTVDSDRTGTNTFSITRDPATGATTQSCSETGEGGCSANSDW